MVTPRYAVQNLGLTLLGSSDKKVVRSWSPNVLPHAEVGASRSASVRIEGLLRCKGVLISPVEGCQVAFYPTC